MNCNKRTFLQDLNCNVYFLPRSDEPNTPKRHMFLTRPTGTEDHFLPADSLPPRDLHSILHLCLPAAARKTPLTVTLLMFAQRETPGAPSTLLSTLLPTDRPLWLGGVRVLLQDAEFERSLETYNIP